MEQYTFHSTYYGYDIYRKFGTGYYVTFIVGVGQFAADTVAGIRETIRDQVAIRGRGNSKPR